MLVIYSIFIKIPNFLRYILKETVFDYLDKRIFSFYQEALKIKKGQFPNPRFLILYPTNVCPFNCIFCDYTDLNTENKRSLKKVEWEYILNEFKNNGGMAIELCGGGEPLATPNIHELINYAAKLNLKVGILTNGLFVNKEKHPKLFDSINDHCSYLRVSMESASQEIFEKVRKTGNRFSFDNILENIGMLIKEKPNNLQVSYKYTIGSVCDVNDLYRAIDLSEEYGFDSVQFKTASNVDEDFREDRSSIERKIKEHATKSLNKTKLICNFSKSTLNKETGCFMSAVHTLVEYNGDVFICCYYRHRMNKHKIGNIFNKNFYDIWHSFEHWEKMKSVNIDECNLYDCRFIKYNKIMKDALETGQLEFI